MEWFYIPLKIIQTDFNTFSWTELDRRLDAIAARGHQAAFRVYLDYPGNGNQIPAFLSNVPTHAYTDYSSTPSYSPDYNNPDVQRALLNFIAAFGARYDGDPRVGFITAGLVGFWGEWHTYPHNEWMAPAAFMNQILDAYEKAFPRTIIQARNPVAGFNNVRPRLGFHDDSFAAAWAQHLENAGLGQVWQTNPLGGEVFPGLTGCIWNIPTCAAGEFVATVASTHTTWLMNHQVFAYEKDPAKLSRATEGARSMGYTLHVPTATLASVQVSSALSGTVTVENRGVAPFYYPWTVSLGVVDAQGKLHTWPMTWDLRTVLPNAPTTWSFNVAGHGLPTGSYTLLVGVTNPLANGKPLRFANSSQDQNLAGWLSLGVFTVKP